MFCDVSESFFSSEFTKIRTSYYRDFYHPELYYEDLPYQNYTGYDLFCLKTQLQPYIRQLNAKLDIGFNDIEYQGAMYVTVTFFKSGIPFKMSVDDELVISNAVKSIMNRRHLCCLLDIKTLDYPQDWLKSIMPFLVEDSIIRGDTIYIALDPDSDYESVWGQLYFETLQAIDVMSQNGYIVINNDKSFIHNWQLIQVAKIGDSDSQSLFKANWIDTRLTGTNLAQFLLNKLNGDLSVSFRHRDRDYSAYKHSFIGRNVIVDNIHSLLEAQSVMYGKPTLKFKEKYG